MTKRRDVQGRGDDGGVVIRTSVRYGWGVEITTPELVSLQRSTGMLNAGQVATIPREQLLALCSELLEHRALLERLGADLRRVVRVADHLRQ